MSYECCFLNGEIHHLQIRSLIKTNGLVNGIFYIVLLNMSAKITKELGMAPGGEFRRAFEEIQRLDKCILQLGDRPLNITLQRALHGLSTWQTIKIFWKLLTSQEKITKEDVEQCKQQDLIEELMQEMAGEYPAFRDVFVSERDLFLCHSLQVAAMPQTLPNGALHPVKVTTTNCKYSFWRWNRSNDSAGWALIYLGGWRCRNWSLFRHRTALGESWFEQNSRNYNHTSTQLEQSSVQVHTANEHFGSYRLRCLSCGSTDNPAFIIEVSSLLCCSSRLNDTTCKYFHRKLELCSL